MTLSYGADIDFSHLGDTAHTPRTELPHRAAARVSVGLSPQARGSGLGVAVAAGGELGEDRDQTTNEEDAHAPDGLGSQACL